MYKLIAIDLDGTLLNRDKEITEENRDFIEEIIDLGYEIVIATGRRYFSAKMLINSIDRHMIILANNGNNVRKSENDEVISTKYLNQDDYKNVIQEGRNRALHPIVHVDYFLEGYDMIIEDNSSHVLNHLYNDDLRIKVIPSSQIYDVEKVLAVVFADKAIILDSFHQQIKEKYPNKFSTHVLGNIDIAEAMFEVMNPLGSKWISLLEYANSIGINSEEIIAIGDDNNDLEMILNAGLGIAMKNATSTVKEAANVITERDNNNSGVAFELSRILGVEV